MGVVLWPCLRWLDQKRQGSRAQKCHKIAYEKQETYLYIVGMVAHAETADQGSSS